MEKRGRPRSRVARRIVDEALVSQRHVELEIANPRCFIDNVRMNQWVGAAHPLVSSNFVDFVVERDGDDFAPVREVFVQDRGKLRAVLVPCVRDKIRGLQAYRRLIGHLQRSWPPGVYEGLPACRRAVRRVRKAYFDEAPFHAFKCDIASFFPSVPHDLILEAARRHAPEEMLPTIESFLKGKVISADGRVASLARGVPAGNPLAHGLSSMVLLDVDREMQRWAPEVCYQRVVDDILIFGDDARRVREAGEHLVSCLRRRKLDLNPDKTARLSRADPFEYLGYRFADGRLSVAARNVRRMQARIRRWTRPSDFWQQRRAGRPRRIVRAIAARADEGVQPWVRSFALLTDTALLRRLDRCLTERTRIALAGKRKGRSDEVTRRLIRTHGPRGFFRTFMRITHGGGS